MTAANSPTYAAGLDDGWRDEARIKACPPQRPEGPQPPFPRYPLMYLRGYHAAYSGAPHVCTEQCRPREDTSERD